MPPPGAPTAGADGHPPTQAAVRVRGLVKRFGDVEALRGVTFEAAPGTVLGVLGPNGAGKTTAVRILATLVRPDAGTAQIAGYDVVRDPAAIRSLIALTGQFTAVDPLLTGRENLVLFGRMQRLSAAAARRRADELLARFDLVEAADRRAVTYSGGMRRRLDISASLVADPLVLFLDEPTTGLDPRSRRGVWAFVEGLRRSGVTIVLTTQYLEEADALADRIVVIDQGQVIAEGTGDELKARVAGRFLEVTLADPGRTARAAELLAPLGSAAPTVDAAAGAVSLPATAGAETLLAAVRALDAAAIAVDDIGLRAPTLDDVFFSLTGPPAADGATAEVTA